MLRVAIPNKGTLAEGAAAMLRDAGYLPRPGMRELLVRDPDNNAEFFFLRPRDIATYVGSGQLDVGITGRDLLLDSGSKADEILALGFGASTFRIALPADRAAAGATIAELDGLRVATAYPGVVERYFATQGISAEVVALDGAVENAVRLGVADAVADVVATGTTLRQAGLEVVGEAILESEAVLVRASGAASDPAVDQLVRRLQGVLVARTYVMVDYDIHADLVDQACELTPGIESPTVSPLHDRGWMAVRAMVLRRDAHRVMDDLWSLGARGIIVTDIHACRL
jgi:ATP phosphoribosyltransferase